MGISRLGITKLKEAYGFAIQGSSILVVSFTAFLGGGVRSLALNPKP